MFWKMVYLLGYLINVVFMFVGYATDNTKGMILNGVIAIVCYVALQDTERLDN